MSDAIEVLIARSSLGTAHATQLRASTDKALAVHIQQQLWGYEPTRPYSSSDSPRHPNRRQEEQMSNRHVVPSPEGGWAVKKPGASRASGNFPTQAGAIGRAREIVRRDGGGEVVIHRPDGQIRDSDTVPPGNDPNPPRDTK